MAKQESLLLSNKLLVAAEAKIESGLTPENRANYMKIVVAGMHTAMAKGPDSILATLQHSKDPINDCAVGAINMCVLLGKQSRGTMPVKAMVPAAMTLMFHALDFADKMGLIKVTNEVLVKAAHIFTNHIFKILNMTPGMIQNAGAKLTKLMQDPANVEAIHRKAGLVKDPRASTPTPEVEDGV